MSTSDPTSRSVWEFPTRLPRHAFSARDAARAGDVWRCFQEVAVEASSRAGWPPRRYRESRTAFVMRTMTVVHHREAEYGEATTARTWVARMRRDMLTTREIRLAGEQGAVADATQEWVHVSAELKPARASSALTESFPEHAGGPSVELPAFTPRRGPTRRFEFACWWTWMDPLDHVNHPAYVDFADEATSRRMIEAGFAPLDLVPVAEKMTFRVGVAAGDRVTVETTPEGTTDAGALVLAHRVLVAPDRLCADGISVRTLAGGGVESLVAAFYEP